MNEVVFYYDASGYSEVVELLDDLANEADGGNKNSRINREKILAYMKALELYGTRLGMPFIRHIQDDIWELRPKRYRLLFWCDSDGKFVFLNWFLKKTKKTPKREIEKALRMKKDWIERLGE